MDVAKRNANTITAASITLIHSPNYPSSFDYSRLIKRYFAKPRFLTEGQVFSIKSSLDFRYHERLQNDLFIGWPVINWKVTKLEPFTRGYVVRGETNLSQAGATQAFLDNKQHSKTDDSDNDLDNYNLLSALERTSYFSTYHKELLALLEPITNKSLDFISTILIHGRSGCGKRILLELTAHSLDINLYRIEANDLIGDNASTTEAKIKTALLRASTFAPCLIQIAKFDLFCHLEELDLERVEQNFLDIISSLNIARSTWPIAIVATTYDFDLLDKSPLSSLFHSNFHMKCLNKLQIEDMTRELMVHSLKYEPNTISSFMEELSKTDLVGMNTGNIIELLAKFDYLLSAFSDHDANKSREAAVKAIQIFNKMKNKAKDKQQPSQTNWSDVGGMSEVKKQIADAIQLPNDYPQLRRPSGILLCGPPGTGKTLLAKAVATECKLNFISVKGPELINMYVGQSEENIRNVFQKAREQAPSVIFFDEFDSLAPNRGQSGDSGGLMDRVVSQILAEMGGITENDNQVFVIGATNRIDLIDKNFLRPGRFDRVIEVPLPRDSKTRLAILEAITRKMSLSDDVNMTEIEEKCPPAMSGADLYSLCANAMKMSLMNCVQQITSGLKSESECDIVISQEDLMKALGEFIK